MQQRLTAEQVRMNAEQVLAALARLRASMPLHRITRAANRKRTDHRLETASIDEFEAEAIAEALEAMADDARALADAAMQAAIEKALDIYYVTEQLARDPQHAELIPHLDNMRRAYERQFGCAVPSKEETEARRAGGAAA